MSAQVALHQQLRSYGDCGVGHAYAAIDDRDGHVGATLNRRNHYYPAGCVDAALNARHRPDISENENARNYS